MEAVDKKTKKEKMVLMQSSAYWNKLEQQPPKYFSCFFSND